MFRRGDHDWQRGDNPHRRYFTLNDRRRAERRRSFQSGWNSMPPLAVDDSTIETRAGRDLGPTMGQVRCPDQGIYHAPLAIGLQ
jgi:hypothetical protein